MFTTSKGNASNGSLFHEPQVCLGPKFAQAQYDFFVSGSGFATPANVYKDAGLTTPFTSNGTGVVVADNFGRFPPIYLDGSIIYAGICYNASGHIVWQLDPYVQQLSTRGLSTNVAYGPKIAATGELSLAAPNAGGSNITLKVTAPPAGAALQISSTLPGHPAGEQVAVPGLFVAVKVVITQHPYIRGEGLPMHSHERDLQHNANRGCVVRWKSTGQLRAGN